jgi:hypothetical protein
MAAKKKNPLQQILDEAGNFVTKQRGKWEHKDWEAFLEKAKRAGGDWGEELRKNLGNILEASKNLYNSLTDVPDKKKAAKKSSKRKARSKKAKA